MGRLPFGGGLLVNLGRFILLLNCPLPHRGLGSVIDGLFWGPRRPDVAGLVRLTDFLF